ncbi:VOC family protein [uncultured Jatrophihabitans sp.]|uniref:VOC family protein n=1 Tax=uncultured Jatrophihabitans sp. TaxID=1610747 RepID=UPI0035CBDD2E
MSLRFYSVVVDCADIGAQARWWAQALGWTVWFEEEREAMIVPPHAIGEQADSAPVMEQPPVIVFVPVDETKTVKNRLHIDLAPPLADDQNAEVERLIALGARRVDVGQGAQRSWVVLADPEGNEFCVLDSRD